MCLAVFPRGEKAYDIWVGTPLSTQQDEYQNGRFPRTVASIPNITKGMYEGSTPVLYLRLAAATGDLWCHSAMCVRGPLPHDFPFLRLTLPFSKV